MKDYRLRGALFGLLFTACGLLLAGCARGTTNAAHTGGTHTNATAGLPWVEQIDGIMDAPNGTEPETHAEATAAAEPEGQPEAYTGGTLAPTAEEPEEEPTEIAEETPAPAAAEEPAEQPEEPSSMSDVDWIAYQRGLEDIEYTLETYDALRQLIDEIVEPQGKAYDEYRTHFCFVPEETIKDYYCGKWALEFTPYHSHGIVQFLSYDKMAFVKVCFSGYGNLPVMEHDFCVCRIGGELRVTLAYPEQIMQAEYYLIRQAEETLGADYISYLIAKQEGRNTLLCNGIESVEMYPLSGSTVRTLMYLRQEENGDVVLSFWLLNGQNREVDFGDVRVLLTDGGMQVIDTTVSSDAKIPAGEGQLVEIVVPAGQVLTGTATWSEFADCSYN